MEKKLVARGMGAGALAGLLAFVFAWIFVGPRIQAAVDYESGRDAAQSAVDSGATGHSLHEAHEAGTELFSRTVQAGFGSGLTLVVFGIAMGTMFAVVFTVALARSGGLRPRTLALLVAGACLLVVNLVPFLKYPANPPAVGSPDTIGARTWFYLITVVVSGVALAAAVWLGRRLRPRLGTWAATLAAGVVFVAVMGALFAALPGFAETPTALRAPDGTIVYDGFPADTLAEFRLYSVLTQVVLWAGIGLLFGPLAERVLSRGGVPTGSRVLASP